MAGTTINSVISQGVVLGTDGFTGPLTITSMGTIEPESTDNTALFIPANTSDATIFNAGFIIGGEGQYNSAGAAGILVSGAATISNTGLINGGSGGYGLGMNPGGAGSDGVDLFAATSILKNAGAEYIRGGSGGFCENNIGGAGGNGVAATKAVTIMNLGYIIGGNGGGGIYGTMATGGVGGDGASLSGNAILTNSGTILGGYGGFAVHGGQGGIGVFSDIGSVSNSGTIFGGVGGYGSMTSGNGGVGLKAMSGTASNAGLIVGGAGGTARSHGQLAGNGGDGMDLLVDKSFTNSGTIQGGAGGDGNQYENGGGESNHGYAGGLGGVGVYQAQGTFTNAGNILGGASGEYSNGATGVFLKAGRLINSGLIIGGSASYGAAQGGTGVALTGGSTLVNSYGVYGGAGGILYAGGGFGGVGVDVSASSFSNTDSGIIRGGTGGIGEYGGTGGYGVAVTSGVVVNNASGLIIGGRGGYGSKYGGSGGAGVLLNGGTFVNNGYIYGGYGGTGGATNGKGAGGNAVVFGTTVGTLVVEGYAVFGGDVIANSTVADVLELAGKSTAALTGIGTQFENFKHISFASGAAWTIAGDRIGLTSGQTIAGFAAGDTIILDGFHETAASYGASGLHLSSGSETETLDLAGSLTGNLIITTNGTNSTIVSEKTASAITLTAGEADYVLNGGTASKFTVDASASLVVEKGGTIANTVLQGGGLELETSGSANGSLTFKGTGGALVVNQTLLPTATISGFASGDKIELLDAAASSGSVAVKVAGVVTVSAGGKSYNLNIVGATNGETDFKFTNHTLTTTKAAAMAFQRPDAAPAVVPAALPDLVAAGGYQVFNGWAPLFAQAAVTASAITLGGPMHELIRVQHGGVETMVTLHAG